MNRNTAPFLLFMLVACSVAGCAPTSIEPTATPVPPTATLPPTATPLPPTETAVPPTATPLPPTETPAPTATLDPTVFELRSPAFGMGERIPILYTCDDRDISPPLEWGDPPDGTQSLLILVEDISADAILTHWIIFNIPPDTRMLPEGVPRQGHLSNGSQQGTNNTFEVGYMGPCPFSTTNEYRFRLYALDTTLDLEDGVMMIPLKQAIRGHVLAETELIGIYSH